MSKSSKYISLYCCGCGKDVRARLTSGAEIYGHRKDLKHLPFWICDNCRNYVGCHHKTKNPTNPLGVIPNAEIRNARKQIHALIDPFWKSGRIRRKTLYSMISDKIGYMFHASHIKSVDEARVVYRAARDVCGELGRQMNG